MSGPALAPQHIDYLEQRAVSSEIAAGRGYRTATSKAELKEYGFGNSAQVVPALVIPIWPPRPAKEPVIYQHRPDNPRRRSDGKIQKFEFPYKAQMHLDVHPMMLPLIGDPNVPLLVVEGVVKADAAVSHLGICTVGLAGVWNWRGTNDQAGKVALSDWEMVAVEGRDVMIAFDSDVMIKESVRAALDRLGALLTRRGAHVRYCYLEAVR